MSKDSAIFVDGGVSTGGIGREERQTTYLHVTSGHTNFRLSNESNFICIQQSRCQWEDSYQ